MSPSRDARTGILTYVAGRRRRRPESVMPAKENAATVAEARNRPPDTDFADPVAAIKYYMEKRGLQRRDLIPIIGSRSKVSEVLSGARPLTMPMARALHRHLGIPAEYLLKDPAPPVGGDAEGIDWHRFPLTRMAKLGWIESQPNLREDAEAAVRHLMARAGCSQPAIALYRKTDHNRANAKTDPYALQAWLWRVLALARQTPPKGQYQPAADHSGLMREVAQCSPAADGPQRAVKLLDDRGIAVVVLRHLPRTHLDGAAMQSSDGFPVIGLTLRYDRLDNFWFVLLHELAHVTRHLTKANCQEFVDDLGLEPDSAPERDADQSAREALVPTDLWEASEASYNPSPMTVIALAHQIGVHPAIVAGRARHENGNYRLLSQLVGTGEVRSRFDME